MRKLRNLCRPAQGQWFILSFSAENSRNSENSLEILKILRKFWKFSENSENSPKVLKIRRKLLKNKVFFWGQHIVSYQIKKPHIVSSRKKNVSLMGDGGPAYQYEQSLKDFFSLRMCFLGEGWSVVPACLPKPHSWLHQGGAATYVYYYLSLSYRIRLVHVYYQTLLKMKKMQQ